MQAKAHSDPFAPPYNPKLLIGDLESDDGDYVVLVLQFTYMLYNCLTFSIAE